VRHSWQVHCGTLPCNIRQPAYAARGPVQCISVQFALNSTGKAAQARRQVERILASAVALREVILGLSLLLGVLLRQAVGAVLDLPLLPALRALVRLVGESLVVVGRRFVH
jgi:hypothetical protein